MTDVLTTAQRQLNMSRIRGKDTKPEMLVRRDLHARGLRYRLHERKLPGRPDLVFPKHHTAVFIHGCFWHGHYNCKYFVVPKTRTDWWLTKINRNKQVDLENLSKLSYAGWKIFIIFECELKTDNRIKSLNKLYNKLKKASS